MLSELPFGSFLTYAPRGSAKLEARSRSVTYALKADQVLTSTGRAMSEEIALRMRAKVPGSELEGYLPDDVVLVPVPRAGLLARGGLWPAERIAQALVTHGGFGARVAPLVVREHAVHSSSSAPGERRLWPDQHYNSMRVEEDLLHEPPRSIALVDDVITRGATLLGAAGRLHEAFPEADLRGFAVVRTRKPGETLVSILDPRVGRIAWRRNWIDREP